MRHKYKQPEKVPITDRQWPDNIITEPPAWCSVDLRDGNQALPIPMSPRKKMEYFEMLLRIGFKQIEVGFPSASQDDFDFVRSLIEGNKIPDDVTISVLTQARTLLIDRTVESLKGVGKAILHCYVATSDLHGKMVFDRDRAGVLKMAVDGTVMSRESIAAAGLAGTVGYEFSPEEFTDSDLDFTIEVCEAVKDAWGTSSKETFILNLPATVERRPPYQYADMIELFRSKYSGLDETMISLHAHNDQGCATAATEMALMAGGERVEGTLFGHGERTGNLDIVILAINLQARGIETGLDFSDLSSIAKMVEEASLIPVHPRHPYAGELVFTAFSGSHQDAIKKGLDNRGKAKDLFGVEWKVPYLHIDPADVGRTYEKLIRINSQSGKGGAAYILEKEFGYTAPKRMHPEIGRMVQRMSDETGAEITADMLLDAFRSEFMDPIPVYDLIDFRREQSESPETVRVSLTLKTSTGERLVSGEGNGPISAAAHALKSDPDIIDFVLVDFMEQTLGQTADAKAVAYLSVRRGSDEREFYGAGEDVNIDRAAVQALFAALNRAAEGS
ncbi:MAG: 2-isopropylmalate synthase [Kiritimatiellaeota bacterium]|nr:2-isopropylmalate synthase [Kiritimatiellota bacterium]